ncbi:efflux RND transporter periplasmic adaptor subunit [Leptospira koniambonensis]
MRLSKIIPINGKTLFLSSVFLLFAAILLSFLVPKISGTFKDSNVKRPSVKTIEIQKKMVSPSIESSGVVDPEEKVEVYFKVPGRIEKVYVDEGDHASKGKLLASLEKFQLEQEKKRFEANLDSSKAQVKLAEEKYEKARRQVEAKYIEVRKQSELVNKYKEEYEKSKKTYEAKDIVFKEGGLSSEEINSARVEMIARMTAYENGKRDFEIVSIGMRDDDIKAAGLKVPANDSAKLAIMMDLNTKIEKAEVEVARASYRSNESLLNSAKQNLREADLYSPMEGFVIKKYKTRGDVISGSSVQGQAVVLVAKLETIYAVFNVSEKDSVRVKKGLEVDISIDVLPEVKYKGIVSKIQPYIEEKTHTLQVSAKVDNKGNKLKPGMFLRTRTYAGEQIPMFEIPRSGFTETGDKEGFVFVIKDKRAYKVTVEVSETRGELILISAGLQEGDQVVVEGVSRLKEGIEVDVLKSEDPEQKQPVGQ